MIEMPRLTKISNGFPVGWKAGSLEKEIYQVISDKIKASDEGHFLLLNTTWMHDDNVSDIITRINPDSIVATNFVDPAIANIYAMIRTAGKPYTIIGNSSEYRVDFWAIACLRFFRQYEPAELQLNDQAKKYICYNRKPHQHRVELAERLRATFPDDGYVTLGLSGSALTLDENFYDDQGINDEFASLPDAPQPTDGKIRNDIYSLGDLRYWRDALLNIVTETEFLNPVRSDFFISEKTWKPVIGLRPFFVYAQPDLLSYLEDQGFDIFRDIVHYPDLTKIRPHQIMDSYINCALETIDGIDDPTSLYASILPRLIANRERFFVYAQEQMDRLNNIDIGSLLRV